MLDLINLLYIQEFLSLFNLYKFGHAFFDTVHSKLMIFLLQLNTINQPDRKLCRSFWGIQYTTWSSCLLYHVLILSPQMGRIDIMEIHKISIPNTLWLNRTRRRERERYRERDHHLHATFNMQKSMKLRWLKEREREIDR